jgi:hypothetical protein
MLMLCSSSLRGRRRHLRRAAGSALDLLFALQMAAVLLLAVGLIAGGWMVTRGPQKGTTPTLVVQSTGTPQIAVEVEQGTTVLNSPTVSVAVTLDPVLVNLTDNRYLKMAVTVTVAPNDAADAADSPVDSELRKTQYDRVRAEALSYLRGRSSTDVLDARFKGDLETHLMELSKLWYGETVADISIGDWILS